jgi:ferredoxin
MHTIVDKETCIGCTLCVQLCQDVFKMEGDKAIAFADPVPSGAEDCVQDASNQCPVSAITVDQE